MKKTVVNQADGSSSDESCSRQDQTQQTIYSIHSNSVSLLFLTNDVSVNTSKDHLAITKGGRVSLLHIHSPDAARAWGQVATLRRWHGAR